MDLALTGLDWTMAHWLAVSLAAFVASCVVGLVRLARHCPTLDD